jgi:hypothetical protein
MSDVPAVEELFEGFRLDELPQDMFEILAGKRGVDPLHALLDPLLLLRLLDVHVLGRGGAAVRVAEDGEDLAQRKLGLSGEPARDECAIEVPDGEAVGMRVELRVDGVRLVREWVEVGDLPCVRVGASQEPKVALVTLEAWLRRLGEAGAERSAPGNPVRPARRRPA